MVNTRTVLHKTAVKRLKFILQELETTENATKDVRAEVYAFVTKYQRIKSVHLARKIFQPYNCRTDLTDELLSEALKNLQESVYEAVQFLSSNNKTLVKTSDDTKTFVSINADSSVGTAWNEATSSLMSMCPSHNDEHQTYQNCFPKILSVNNQTQTEFHDFLNQTTQTECVTKTVGTSIESTILEVETLDRPPQSASKNGGDTETVAIDSDMPMLELIRPATEIAQVVPKKRKYTKRQNEAKIETVIKMQTNEQSSSMSMKDAEELHQMIAQIARDTAKQFMASMTPVSQATQMPSAVSTMPYPTPSNILQNQQRENRQLASSSIGLNPMMLHPTLSSGTKNQNLQSDAAYFMRPTVINLPKRPPTVSQFGLAQSSPQTSMTFTNTQHFPVVNRLPQCVPPQSQSIGHGMHPWQIYQNQSLLRAALLNNQHLHGTNSQY